MSEVKKEILFYMNNPCLVIRKISDLLIEIQVNVNFAGASPKSIL